MKFNKKLAVAVSGAVLLMAGQIALADSTTDIVDALVSKGILTEEEGKLISKGHESKKKAEGTVGFKDGFKFNSGDGKNNISVNGRIQADYRSFNEGGKTSAGAVPAGTNSGANFADTFDIRRSYLTAKGTFGRTSFEATLNAGAVKYYWLEYAFLPSDKLNVRFGQFKTPMGLEVQTSSRFNDMTERDFTASLTDSINKGIMVHGVPLTGTTYQFMVSNGGLKYEEGETAAELSNYRDGKAFTGRLTANIAEMMGNKDAIVHFGGSYGVNTDLPTYAASDFKIRTNARGAAFFALANPSAGLIIDPRVERVGLETVLATGPYKLAGEYNNMSISQSGYPDKDLEAYYINASWMITGENYSQVYKQGLMGGRMAPKNNFTGFDGSGWGAWELGVRYSNFDAQDWTAANGYTNKAKSYTVGLKWITDPNTRFLLNYVNTDFDTAITGGYSSLGPYSGEQAVNFRAQFDF
jgi:phosphate-selective porin OprO and OprP